jgi:hypothetical protein
MTSIDSFGTFSALHSMLTLAAGNRVFAQTRSDVLKDWPILMGFFPTLHRLIISGHCT